MNGVKRRALIWLGLALLLAVLGFKQYAAGLPLQTNLLALLPPTERNPMAETAVSRLAEAAGNRAIFLIGGNGVAPKENADGSPVFEAARRFAERLRQAKGVRQVVAEIPVVDAEQIPRFYLPYRFSLLGAADRQAAADGRLVLSERLQHKLYAPFNFGPAFSLADDPFGLGDDWLAGLPLRSLRLELQEGFLVARDADGRVWVMVLAELAGSAYDGAVQKDFTAALAAAEKALASELPQGQVLRTGTVFYASEARQSAEREFDVIGAGSLIGMLALLFLVFRSLRPLALGLLSVGFGVAAATAATIAVYGEMHLITLVFGASLIGEAIDYSIQYFAARLGAGAQWNAPAGLRRIAPGLLMALATSLLGYAAMALAPFPALRQIALFALVGLSAACASVFLLLPWFLQTPDRQNPERAVAPMQRFLDGWQRHVTRRHCLLVAVLLVATFLPGWARLTSNDDVHMLISRPPALVAQEEKIRELTGFGGGSQFFLVEGGAADEVLAREERLLDRLAVANGQGPEAATGYLGVSMFVPSPGRQQQNRHDWAQNVFADAPGLKALLAEAELRDEVIARLFDDYQAGAGQNLSLEHWLASPWSSPYRYLWLGKNPGGAPGLASIVQIQDGRDVQRLATLADGLPGVTFVDKAGSVSRLFGDYRRWSALWLLGALSLVYALMRWRYGWMQAALMLLPTALAFTVVLGAFGYLGVGLTLFSMMGFVLVLGVGVNYAIFLREGGVSRAATLAGVMLSSATTLLSFGLLAFSSMPVLSGFGLTLLFGILVSVLLAPMILSFMREGQA